ncbi:hypothetical protein MYSTI_07409 [Myxococcus stipitatus DSM 14675]|uniref:Uncharacterized protein n=1 Tax=Myxococcus stipitatus (strain DSM 14675 / JCM 12634 / Mx s8) TaxID=1278073 RepID=L7UI85_MYXSD|nr:hypothetical protein [Myxococcus stipitatus]AGC48681.1 hypothetical protein MYSTI_07409 [Myxococcus stipitatus DSM 14675]
MEISGQRMPSSVNHTHLPVERKKTEPSTGNASPATPYFRDSFERPTAKSTEQAQGAGRSSPKTLLGRLKAVESGAWKDYDKLKANPPQRKDFTKRSDYLKAKKAHARQLEKLEDKASAASVRRIKVELGNTASGRALVKDLEKQGVKIHVDDDPNYPEFKDFPSRAKTTGDKKSIHIRRSAAKASDSPEVLFHEAVHAVLGNDLAKAQTGDAGPLRAHLKQLGLDPADADRIKKVTGGWGNPGGPGANEHVLTAVLTYRYQRELAKQPPLSGARQDELVRRTAQRELALSLLRNIDRPDSKLTLTQALAMWKSLPQYVTAPKSTSDADIRAFFEEYAKESYVDPSAF